ncbi:unnamed protein product [marine sediment metagenome]|uniref:Uncharacterized protein n=1 Tax=marine sediment metagenome TaxID=412755 RepID=X1L3W8_9ZZZZ
MDKSGRSIKASFILVQPEGVARTWADPELTRVLAEFLKIWAGTVDGEAHRFDITVDGSEPAPPSAISPP